MGNRIDYKDMNQNYPYSMSGLGTNAGAYSTTKDRLYPTPNSASATADSKNISISNKMNSSSSNASGLVDPEVEDLESFQPAGVDGLCLICYDMFDSQKDLEEHNF